MKLQWIKKNKKKCFIQDGIIKYTLFLKEFPKCICMKDNQFCKHLKYYFSEVIGLERWKIEMLDINYIKEKINKENLQYAYITDLCLDYLKENDCGICLEALEIDRIYKCLTCKKIVHYHCFKSWVNKNKKKNCIYCNTEINLF